MLIKTYLDKNNTIIKNSSINTGLNPVTELFYGGPVGQQKYSRFLFHFDETRLKNLYTGGTFTDLTKLKHTLRLTNTTSFDTAYLNGTMDGKNRGTSFDLILFEINQPWDNGTGYDYEIPLLSLGQSTYYDGFSNWYESNRDTPWANGNGVYSGNSSGVTITTQHFDKGNENIEMDITNYVNGLLTGNTNYGLGIAYPTSLEKTNTNKLNYIGFFTNNTQTFYEPYVETKYDNHIVDDRNNFYLDKNNKLYLYVNLGGNPTNLDTKPICTVYDNIGNVFNTYSGNQINHITLGVYSININVPDITTNIETMYNDVWSNIIINGSTRPNVTLDFVVKDSTKYFNISSNDLLPTKIAISISNLQNKEKVKRGDIRKVNVSARIPYTVEQTQNISKLEYRIYVSEGSRELTVIDYEPVELTTNNYYFLLDTLSLIPNTYYLDIRATTNLEVTLLTNVIQFEIINQVELRKGS
jgi:hypothetical protein